MSHADATTYIVQASTGNKTADAALPGSGENVAEGRCNYVARAHYWDRDASITLLRLHDRKMFENRGGPRSVIYIQNWFAEMD